ncbi:MAG TPA: aspartate aminotransferase family protein [Bryobacteraceae bacterium]|nr:aspartate aminotransferase family protein [Bryobacteraceae bacterium]
MEASTLAAPTPAAASSSDSVVALENQYLLQNYARYPLVLARGKGCYVYDTSGKRYLDFITGIGVNALGHAHPRLMKVIREQSGRMLHCSNLYYHEYQGPLAARIAKASGMDRVFFCNSGTEAMEGALKMVRAHGRKTNPDKFETVALDDSFHGRTFGALSITGQEKYRRDFEPMLPGARFTRRNDIAALEEAVSERTAGIVLELVQGEGGIHPMTVEFVRKARELADRYNALLVFDETQCGVGRPGVYFSYQLNDPIVLPDVTVAAKPLACGIPLGFVAATEAAASSIGSGMHGTTFGGGPLACRTALEFFDILDELLPNISQMGEYFRTRLAELKGRYSFIKEVRGPGLMIGVEIEFPGKQIVLDAIEAGLLLNCTHDVVLRFLPPYIVGKTEIDRAMRVLEKVFKKAKPPAA